MYVRNQTSVIFDLAFLPSSLHLTSPTPEYSSLAVCKMADCLNEATNQLAHCHTIQKLQVCNGVPVIRIKLLGNLVRNLIP